MALLREKPSSGFSVSGPLALVLCGVFFLLGRFAQQPGEVPHTVSLCVCVCAFPCMYVW